MDTKTQSQRTTRSKRVLCLTLGILTQSVTFAPLMAQNAPQPQNPAPATGSGTQTQNQGNNARGSGRFNRLRVVPRQRQDSKSAQGNQGNATPAGQGATRAAQGQGNVKPAPGSIVITPDGKMTKTPGGTAPSGQNKNNGVITEQKPIETNAPPLELDGNKGQSGNSRAFQAGNSTPFSFSFNGSEISNVLKFFAQMSNLNVVMDPTVSGQVTIINPKPVTLNEAFTILQAVLGQRGFTALQNGNVLSVVPLNVGVTQTTYVNPNTENGVTVDPRNQVMTQVIPLDNVDAESLARELTPLISRGASMIGSPGTNSLILTDTSSNIKRINELVNALDKTSNNTELMVYPLRYAEASTIADTINNLFKQTTTRGRGGGQPQQPGMPQPQPGQPGATGGGRPSVIATADVRTNQVLVVASAANQQMIARDIINRLDDDGTSTLDTETRKIKYADATQVASQVNQILSNLRPSGAGGGSNPSFGSRTFGGGFNPFGGGNQSQDVAQSTDPFGKVIADARTNTVIITASEERKRKINELIDTLDVDVPVESTTFVIPLKNAQADDVAYALSQAFATGSQQNNGFGNFFFGGFGQQQQRNQGRTPINRRLGGSTSNTGRAARIPPGPPNAPGNGFDGGYNGAGGGSAMPEGVPGVMTPNGFVPTQGTGEEERTRQYYYGDYYGGRQSRLGQAGGVQYGRGQSGSYVNLLRLQNNAFVTPSPYGDSLIITTTPDNYKTILDLIQQLDVVQPQVMIEVIIAEVTLDKNERLGFTLGGRFANLFNRVNTAQAQVNLPASGSGNTFDTTASGSQFTVSGANYSALLQALSTDSKVRVISTPRIFTSNNQEAYIDISTQLPYVDGQNVTAGLNGNILTNTIERANVGFTLTVTPRIARQGLVTIDVVQQATDLLRYDTLGTGQSAIRVPVINNREADTSVTVMDKETIVIGGLIRESNGTIVNKIPIISEIPLIGQFFRSREKTKNKVELMIFLRPHVVRSVEEARELTKGQGNLIVPSVPELKTNVPLLNPPPKDGTKPMDVNSANPNAPNGNNGNGTANPNGGGNVPQSPPPGESSTKN